MKLSSALQYSPDVLSLDTHSLPIVDDVFAIYGQRIIERSIKKLKDSFPVGKEPIDWESSESARFPQEPTEPAEPVGILGAGVTGLYTALILLDLGIPFKIIEARERVGGRLFTYTFPDEAGAPYNYYDVGAMRFPQMASMQRVFHLFNYPPINDGALQLHEKLRPYYPSNPNALMSYNGETHRQSDAQSTSFQPEAVIRDVIPTPYVNAGYRRIIDDVVEPFASRIYADMTNHAIGTGWEYLMRFDLYSARAYMSIEYRPSTALQQEFGIPNEPLSVDVVNWMETFDTSTGAYDRALSEIVLEAIAFGWQPPDSTEETAQMDWWCIDGGAFQIAYVMYQYVKREAPDAFTFNKCVTGIKTVEDANGKVVGINVTTNNNTSERFSHVVTSIPLPVLRAVDLGAAGLTPMQSNALRHLTYGPSIKIGMQFRSAWWTMAVNSAGRPLDIVGGQTYTDSPLRTVVYPSFGDVHEGKTTTLIASYCWTDDAERLSALITNEELKPVLIELVLRELARIHDVTLDFLRGELIDTHAWSWSHDPYTMGAFALFGPGKFSTVYESLTTPAASGHLHFAGEALSTRHAWVEGALDSAWRAVFELLIVEPAWKPLLFKFFKHWGYNKEWWAPTQVKPEPHSDDGELDVDEFMKGSLLPRHILATGGLAGGLEFGLSYYSAQGR